jgi:hypothetical protein
MAGFFDIFVLRFNWLERKVRGSAYPVMCDQQ